MIRLGILGSTRGTSLLPILTAISEQRLSATVAVVISNRVDAQILERARDANIPAQFISPESLTRTAYDHEVSAVLHAHQVDLVVLIGYMRILSSEFVHAWQNKIINVHPSLLPAYAGGMDLAVHQAVCDAKETQSGCTVHIVTEAVDAGPILAQRTCAVLPDDTAETLKVRVQALEGEALIAAIGYFNPG